MLSHDLSLSESSLRERFITVILEWYEIVGMLGKYTQMTRRFPTIDCSFQRTPFGSYSNILRAHNEAYIVEMQ